MTDSVENKYDGTGLCPATLALALLSRKWSLHILMSLVRQDKPVRFGQLQRAIPGISQRELTKHLRDFEQSGLVRREVFAQVPPRVEYALTPLGLSLLEPVTALHHWAERHGPAIEKHRLNKGKA
jgi:DNA-binding HxlR family transcriptional regulator